MKEGPSEHQTAKPASLVGKWRKVSQDPQTNVYPDEIEFLDHGIYFGKNSEATRHVPVWDSGGYQLPAPNEARIATFTDKEITYSFSLEGDVLTFQDPQGRKIKYLRAV